MKDATFEERSEFYRNAISVKEAVTSALRNKNYHNLADNPNVTVYTGVGSFVSSDVVSVRTSTEEIMLTSKQIIINTGAETVIPPIEGVVGNRWFMPSTLNHGIDRASPPTGYYRWRLHRFGVCVYVCFVRFTGDRTRKLSELIVREDRDIAASVKKTLEKKGIVFRMNAKVQSVKHIEDGAVVVFF